MLKDSLKSIAEEIVQGAKEIVQGANNFVDAVEDRARPIVRPIVRGFERVQARMEEPRLTPFERALIKLKGDIEEALGKFAKYIEGLSCLTSSSSSRNRAIHPEPNNNHRRHR